MADWSFFYESDTSLHDISLKKKIWVCSWLFGLSPKPRRVIPSDDVS
jgi:hypothetical protein